MKLYELVKEDRNLDELFYNSIDEDTGEIKDSETLDILQHELKNALTRKSTGVIKVIKNMDADIESVDAEIKRLQAVKKRAVKEKENFMNYIIYIMQQLETKSIQTPIGKLAIRESPAVDIYDMAKLPNKYIKEKIEYSADKTAIKEAIKNNEEVEGARIVKNISLNIR